MWKSILFLLIAMISIQSGATLAKQLFPMVGPAGASTLRLLFATIILWLTWRPWKAKLTKESLRSVALYGVSLGLMNLLFYFSLLRIPLGIAVALEFTGPLAVAIFSSKRKLDLIWGVIAGIGIYLILPLDQTSAPVDLVGILYALGAGFFWALYILFGKKAGGNISGTHAASWGMLFATIIVTPFGIASSGVALLNLDLFPIAICVGLFSSALPYTLEMFALRDIPLQTFGVLMSLEPAIATIAGLVFLSEDLSHVQVAAIMCIMLSSLGSSLTCEQTIKIT